MDTDVNIEIVTFLCGKNSEQEVYNGSDQYLEDSRKRNCIKKAFNAYMDP